MILPWYSAGARSSINLTHCIVNPASEIYSIAHACFTWSFPFSFFPPKSSSYSSSSFGPIFFFTDFPPRFPYLVFHYPSFIPRFLTSASLLCARVRWMIIITRRVFKPSTFYLQVCPMPPSTHFFSLGWRCTQRFQRPRHWSLVSMTVIMYT